MEESRNDDVVGLRIHVTIGMMIMAVPPRHRQ